MELEAKVWLQVRMVVGLVLHNGVVFIVVLESIDVVPCPVPPGSVALAPVDGIPANALTM